MIGSMLRRAQLSGDGSTLSLDFTQMSTLADLTGAGLTFSRSTSGTYINASGLVATATAGNPRFDYDTSGNPRGILIEGSATNLLYHSETFRLTAVASEPYWADSASVSRGDDTAPDGTAAAAVNFVAIGTAGTVIQTAAVGSSANRTFSFWAKRSGGGTVEYTLDNGTTWTAVTITASWVRYTATATNANQRVGFRVATGAGTSIWGAQLEVGNGSSSYVTSGSSQGSRGADSCVMTGTNFSSWFAGATEGVLWAECERPRKIESPAADHGIVGSRYQSGGWLGIGATATNQYPSSILWPTGGFQFAGGIATRIPLVSRQAVRWFNANDITNFSNGTQGVTNTAGTGSVTPAMLTIGANSTSGLAGNLEWLNGCVRRVKFWPVALPDSQIIALTT